jgi:hypothetical protein
MSYKEGSKVTETGSLAYGVHSHRQLGRVWRKAERSIPRAQFLGIQILQT